MNKFLFWCLPIISAPAVFGSANVAPAISQFAVRSYEEVSSQPGNLILSPVDLYVALSMLLAGARGSTATQIATVLDQPHPPDGFYSAIAELQTSLSKQANLGANRLSMANAVWLQRGFPLQPEFEQTMEHQYQAPLTPLDFRTDPAAAAAQINNWTAQHTENKIPELFSPGSIERDTRMILSSAIYFYGKWKSPFPLKATSPEPFHPAPRDSVTASFMHQTSSFRYAETDTAQVLEMNYDGTPLAFDIILPKAVGGLGELERSLTQDKLTVWFSGLSSRKVDVSMPKFRAESQFQLQKVLSRMGMAEAFSRSADFSGIDGRRDLFVGSIVHKAFVDVGEQGTEAAAATGITVRPLAMRREEEPVVFRADHPFLFFVRDTTTGTILFAGRLSKP